MGAMLKKVWSGNLEGEAKWNSKCGGETLLKRMGNKKI
jgi:hypothetical protein